MSPHEEIFCRLLERSSQLLEMPDDAGLVIPDDELHREIIVPLLPAMLGDTAIRQHWLEQTATGFPARLARHFDCDEPPPRWQPADFEIHVAASYSASADARALADTLLSEESLREMTAGLMNDLLDLLWGSLASVGEYLFDLSKEKRAELKAAAPLRFVGDIDEGLFYEPRDPAGFSRIGERPSRALIRALCGKISASAFQRGLVASSAPSDMIAAIIARRIFQRATMSRTRRRVRRGTARLG